MRAVESVLAQTWPRIEIVISDNASTDETEVLCKSLEATHTAIRYIRQDYDIGPEANFHEVLLRARGELFIWLADDDWLEASYISQCAADLVANDGYALVCGRARYVRDGRFVYAERPMDLHSSSPAVRVLDYYRTVTLNGAFYGLMRRPEVVRASPLLPRVGADWLLVASVAYQGRIRTLSGVAVNRSMQGGSKDAVSLARTYNLTRRQARHWQLLAARSAFDDIVSGSVYQPLGARRRFALAVAVYSLVVVRFSWKVYLGVIFERLGVMERARGRLEARRRESG
jgi:glycosyltransferase involved in cell wall biosynthesis